MTARNSNNARWTDEEIEKLLVDFYRQELPRELPPLRVPATVSEYQPVTVSARTSANPGRRGFAGIAVAACLLLLFVALLSPINNDKPTTSNRMSDSGVAGGHQPARDAAIARKPVFEAGPEMIVVPDGFGPLRRPDHAPLLPELTPWWNNGIPASSGEPLIVDPPKNDWLDRLDIRIFPVPEKRKSPELGPRRLPEQN